MEYSFFLFFLLSIGFLFGIISSTPLGPINLLVAENYLAEKKVKIIPFLFGVILVDAIFGYLTFWGFDKYLSDFEMLGSGIGIIGGLAIILLGVLGAYQIHNNDKKSDSDKDEKAKKKFFANSSTASFSKGFFLCASNPGFIAFWSWVAFNAKNWTNAYFPDQTIGFYNLAPFPIGIILGDFLWFGFFTYLLKKGAKKYSSNILDKIRLVISYGLILLGIYTLYISI